jgi:hypothetical protein
VAAELEEALAYIEERSPVYEATEDQIAIHGVRHAARRLME